YVEDHKPFTHYVVASVPSAARGSLKTFLEKLGYNQKDIANYLKEHEKEIRSAVNIPDPKSSKAIKDAISQSKGFLKYADYVEGAGWVFAGLGFYSGYQDDRANGKTGGGALGYVATGAAVLAGASPVGWAAAAGIGISFAATFTFEYLYDNNKFSIQ